MNTSAGFNLRGLPLKATSKFSRGFARRAFGAVTSFQVEQPFVALTFDDGPNPECTPLVLELLEKANAKGTFFVTGQSAASHPDLIKQIHIEGHALGNHSYTHRPFTALNRVQRFLEVLRMERLIPSTRPRLFRPPWGKLSRAASLDLALLGYSVIKWNVEVQDWLERDSSEMSGELVENLRPGCVLLLHDAICIPNRAQETDQGLAVDRTSMLRALGQFLEQTRDYRFVTVPELMSMAVPVRST